MNVLENIWQYFLKLSTGTIITTREVLHMGKRNSIDQSMSRLVNRGMIVRLARGVFTRLNPNDPIPTSEEIALAKSKGWEKYLSSHAKDNAAEFKLVDSGNLEPTFFADGPTTSFRTHDGTTITFMKASPKKMEMGESKLARVARALWYFKKQHCDVALVSMAVANAEVTFLDVHDFVKIVQLIPAWLSDQLRAIEVFASLKLNISIFPEALTPSTAHRLFGDSS